eukprot:4766447-Amphidinium_carterae.2
MPLKCHIRVFGGYIVAKDVQDVTPFVKGQSGTLAGLRDPEDWRNESLSDMHRDSKSDHCSVNGRDESLSWLASESRIRSSKSTRAHH